MVKSILAWFNNEYEKILHSGLSNNQKSMEYGNLMTEMEQVFKIPIRKNQKWEKENPKLIALYHKLSKSRDL